MSDLDEKYDLLDLDRDLPTTKEDVEKLWELSNQMITTSLADVNSLLDPFWTLEKARSMPFFSDDDEPFEL